MSKSRKMHSLFCMSSRLWYQPTIYPSWRKITAWTAKSWHNCSLKTVDIKWYSIRVATLQLPSNSQLLQIAQVVCGTNSNTDTNINTPLRTDIIIYNHSQPYDATKWSILILWHPISRVSTVYLCQLMVTPYTRTHFCWLPICPATFKLPDFSRFWGRATKHYTLQNTHNSNYSTDIYL